MTDNETPPPIEDIRFFQQIADDIKARPEFYRPAGEWIDREYSRAGMAEKGLRGGETPLIRLWEATRPFRNHPPAVPTELESKVIVLVTWLLTDTKAGEAGLGLTELEKWRWLEITIELDSMHRGWASYICLGAEEWRGWTPLVRRAWAVIGPGASIEHPQQQKAKASPAPSPKSGVLHWAQEIGRAKGSMGAAKRTQFLQEIADLRAGLRWLRYPPAPLLPKRDRELLKMVATDRERAVAEARQRVVRVGAAPSEEFPESLKPSAKASDEELYRRLDPSYTIVERKAKRAIDAEEAEVRKRLDLLFTAAKGDILLWSEVSNAMLQPQKVIEAYERAISDGGPENDVALEPVIRDLERIRAKLLRDFNRQLQADGSGNTGSAGGDAQAEGQTGRQPHAKWTQIRAEREVEEYLSLRAAQYNRLVPGCLAGDEKAKKEFLGAFGPTAIAGALGDGCQKGTVARTGTYKEKCQPVLRGETPKGWTPPEQHSPELDANLAEMRRQAGGQE